MLPYEPTGRRVLLNLKLLPRSATFAGALLLGLLPAAGARAAGGGRPAGGAPATGIVDVAAATVWTSPDKPRTIDAPALGNPVDLSRWLANMDTAQRRALTADNATQTQVLYGRQVLILRRRGGWDEVAVPGQPTPKNALGYPGWVPAAQVVRNPTFAGELRHGPFAQVDSAPVVWLYDDARLAHRFMQIGFDTRLPVIGRDAGRHSIEVATPSAGPKWIDAADASVYPSISAIPYPTGADLVNRAERLVGTAYVWGGRSGWMLDCSGLVGAVYASYGIVLPRDADAQAKDGGGTRVATASDRTTADLQPGDVLFYARDGGTGRVDHTALYAGGGRMIEAYDAGVPVRVTRVRFGSTYWGAVRYLHA